MAAAVHVVEIVDVAQIVHTVEVLVVVVHVYEVAQAVDTLAFVETLAVVDDNVQVNVAFVDFVVEVLGVFDFVDFPSVFVVDDDNAVAVDKTLVAEASVVYFLAAVDVAQAVDKTPADVVAESSFVDFLLAVDKTPADFVAEASVVDFPAVGDVDQAVVVVEPADFDAAVFDAARCFWDSEAKDHLVRGQSGKEHFSRSS